MSEHDTNIFRGPELSGVQQRARDRNVDQP
jgi:hypothetical protein